MNGAGLFGLHIIHAAVIESDFLYDILYTGETEQEALEELLAEGTCGEALGYDLSEALASFEKDLLCISRFQDGFVYLDSVGTAEELADILSAVIRNPGESFASEETLKHDILAFNEMISYTPPLRPKEKEAILNEYRRKTSALWSSGSDYSSADQLEYTIRHLNPREFPDQLYLYLRYSTEIYDVTPEFMIFRLFGSSLQAYRFVRNREKIETLLNDGMRKYFPQALTGRTLLFFM